MFARPGFSPLLIGGGGSGLKRTFQGYNTIDPAGSSANFGSFNFGDEDAGRFLVVGAGVRDGASGADISSVTVDGNAATLLKKVANGSGSFTTLSGLYGLVLASGASGDIVINYSTSVNEVCACLWSVLGLNSTTPTDDASDAPINDREISLPVDADDGGVSFAMSTWRRNDISDVAWEDINRDFYVAVGGQHFSAASQQSLPAGTRSIVATADSFGLDSIAGVAITMR